MDQDGDLVMIAPCGMLHLTKKDVDPRAVLVGALEEGLTEVLVLGIDRDGEHFAASSTGEDERLDALWSEFVKQRDGGEYVGGCKK
jgi:hypothetical protein